MIALYESLGRLPTPDEKERFLASMAQQVGGERIYIAHRQLDTAELVPEIQRLRTAGYSVRRIAAAVNLGKSRVAEMLSDFSPYEVDSA
jgi:hypothetical protein